MTDLRARMRIYDQAPAPDYWSEVELRASTVSAAEPPHRSAWSALLLVAALLTILMISAAVAIGSGVIELPWVVESPTPSPAALEEWTPERTRAEGSPVGFLGGPSGPSPSGLDAQLYCISQAIPSDSPCDRYHSYDPEEDQHWAVEVTQGGRSALFEVLGTPLVEDFDEDSFLVEDGTDQAPRFRLLQADGTAVQLRELSDLAPAIPGPDVLLIQNLDVYRRGSVGADGPEEPPYLVDDRAGTLQRLDVPEEIKWWGPNVDEFLWGGNGCRVIWQQPDGSFDHHDEDCQFPVGHTDPGLNWGDGFADWLEPGRMALVEWGESGGPLVVHASLDRGATWDRIEVAQRDWGDTTGVIADALADVMRQLDLRSSGPTS